MKPSQLICQQVYFHRKQRAIIRDFSLRLSHGEACVITGQNGSGKSTLLKLVAGLYWPDQGNIALQHQSNHWLSTQADYAQHGHYLSHENGLKLALTVKENLDLMHILYGEPPCPHKTAALVDALQFNQQLYDPVHTLSFGQRRRLAFARLFIKPKTVWILDEPFTGIDLHHQQYLKEKINQHLHHNGMAVISTHDALAFDGIHTHRINLS